MGVLMETELRDHRAQVTMLSRDLVYLSPSARVDNARQYVDGLAARTRNAIQSALALRRERIRGLAGELDKLSPTGTLARGYAMATDVNGELLRDAEQAAIGDRIRVRLHRGILGATVEAKEEDNE